jgi:DNA-binding MarR family transcriptional regulator
MLLGMTTRLEKRTALCDGPGSPQAAAYLAIVRANDVLATEVAKFFTAYDITPQQYNALRVLYVRSQECGLRCSDIAERMLNREPDMTRLLDRLERAGFTERHRCTNDRRVVWIELTDKGFDLVEAIHEPLQRFHEETMAALDPAELDSLRALLERLITPDVADVERDPCTGA